MTSVDGLLVADWRRRFQVARQLPAQGTLPAEPLEVMFRRLTRRTRDIHRSKWLTQPSLGHIQQRVQLTLNLTQILLEELPQVGDARWTAFWAELAHEVDRLLSDIEQQIAACDFVLEGIERLHALAEPVYHGTETSGLPLWNFAKEWHTVLQEHGPRTALVLRDAAGLSDALIALGWKRAEWSVQALLTARFIASITPTALLRDENSLTALIAAALLQDLGAWSTAGLASSASVAEARRIHRDPSHPGRGAAILAGLSDFPVYVGLLVGTHHERLDGTGYPQRLSGSQFRVAMQWFAMHVRFVELLTDPVTAHLALSQNESQLHLAALRLWREVRRGGFAEHWVRGFLDAIQPQLSQQIAQRFADHMSRLVDTRHDIPAPRGKVEATPGGHDGSAVNAPAFLRRRLGQQKPGSLGPREARITGNNRR